MSKASHDVAASTPWMLLLALLLAGLFAGGVRAQQHPAPDALVRETADKILEAIKDTDEFNRAELLRLAETLVAPHFDFTRMTRLAVGRAWRQATPQERQALEQEFRTLLVRTYTNALSGRTYKEATVTVRPLQAPPDAEEVIVRTQVREQGNPKPWAVNYELARTPQGWKVFDVIVDEISLVTNYRDQFAQEINRAGVGGLIESLRAKNRSLAQGKPAPPAGRQQAQKPAR